jgi:hypothetical protein
MISHTLRPFVGPAREENESPLVLAQPRGSRHRLEIYALNRGCAHDRSARGPLLRQQRDSLIAFAHCRARCL